jgi:hypothetical protein
MRRDKTDITERHGGVHNQRAMALARSMLTGHGFARARLYHVVLIDHAAESPTSTRRYQAAIKALCRKLRQDGIPARWRACIERDEEKGLHCHLFVLVDSTTINPCSIINAKRHGPQAWLHEMLAARFMTFHLAAPKADMHRVGGNINGRRKNYATLAGDKLADCQVWISYLAKRRSKPSDLRTIYLSSRDSNPRPSLTRPPPQAVGDNAKKEIAVYRERVVDERDKVGDEVPATLDDE